MSKIIVVSGVYPTESRPHSGAFVKGLVDCWGRLGHDVEVINPRSISSKDQFGFKVTEKFIDNELCIAGGYISFSNKKIGPIDTASWSREAFKNCSLRCFRHRREGSPDYFYGKFLMTGGLSVSALSQYSGKPAFVDCGESTLLESMNAKDIKKVRSFIPYLAGAICVSERLKNEVIELGFSDQDVFLAPNCPDLAMFYPMDKNAAREKLGIPKNKAVVAFTGHFIERKGPKRVLEAIKRAGKNVVGVFLGEGCQEPGGDQVFYAGPVAPKEVNLWLNSADIFMLPTLAEGNCNAINEAMAVGLPILTSKINDVVGQVTVENSILKEPYDVVGFSEAIINILNNPVLKESMGTQSRKLVEKRCASSREERILSWMESKI